jgi:2-polyprenyl-6-methoxyphenol hydroxylase-like FAD-dependent oxidoreductase
MSSASGLHGKKAIVIGGSLGGLITARALRNHFEEVIILEKDKVNNEPESRKGQPHTKHLHGLLPAGLNVMMHYFPDLLQLLKDNDANVVDLADSMHWYTHGGYRKSFTIGLTGTTVSRPLLEHIVRQKVLGTAGITMMDQASVKQLLTSNDHNRVPGVVVEQKNIAETVSMFADMVIDVSGRGSRTAYWLSEMGYQPPLTSEVKVNVGYATRIYERDTRDPMSKKWVTLTPTAPLEYRMAGAFPIEGNRWIVSMGGWHGQHAPVEEPAFLEFARSLPVKDIYKIVSTSKPLSEITQYKYSSSLRRHYEKLQHFPTGYLILGDALCSFNPVYGQGMTVAALEAKAIDELLKQKTPDDKLAKKFFRRAAKIIDIPWGMAVGEDFRFAETNGPKPPAIKLINKYVTLVHKATLKDQVVCDAFLKVMSLLKPPTSLFHPKIAWRVLFR